MLRLGSVSMLVMVGLLVLGPFAVAEDDDGVMGVWQGKFSTPGWEDKVFSTQIIALGLVDGVERWRMILVFGDWQAPDVKAEIQGVQPDKNVKQVQFEGNVDLGSDLGGKYLVQATFGNGAIAGQMKGKGPLVEFMLQRMEIKSPTLGEAPPVGAVVLMDGTNLDAWERYPLKYNLVEDGAMEVSSSSLKTIQDLGSGRYHVEFRTPFMPRERGQGRGNSGVYILGRYEVQVLDSFALEPADNLCGGIYKKAVPRINACLPPLTWQTYDISFKAAQFDGAGKKTGDAYITVVHNGVVIHNNVKLDSPTPGGTSDADAAAGPLLLQNHGNPVRFRNIWFVPAAG